MPWKKLMVVIAVAVVSVRSANALHADDFCEPDDLECTVDDDGGIEELGDFSEGCTTEGTLSACGSKTVTRRRCLSWQITSANGTVTFSPIKPSGGAGLTISCADEETTTITYTLYRERAVGGTGEG
jgi:hypothetical protein